MENLDLFFTDIFCLLLLFFTKHFLSGGEELNDKQ